MSEKPYLNRYPVYRYKKSRKLIGVIRQGTFRIVELSDNLNSIVNIREQKFIKFDAIEKTEYVIEVEEANDDKQWSVKLLRTLTAEDMNLDNYNENKSLEELLIGRYEHINREELYWAGKREGTFGENIPLILITAMTTFFAVGLIIKDETSILFIIISALMIYACFTKTEWKRSRKADPLKIEELKKYKKIMLENAEKKHSQMMSEFEKNLEEFDYWEKLSPQQFEHALAVKLKELGYDLKTTQYIGDGGIDLEGTNKEGETVIVQAKKYSSNIGVAVVREMLGVRENRPDKPLTLIVGLGGFTRGAESLAKEEGIILISIKELVLI
jgi:restriction system protein